MRFIDSNIFLHAYFTRKKPLTKHEIELKDRAKEIIVRVSEGEGVTTTTTQVAEILNIIESRLGQNEAVSFLSQLLAMDNIRLVSVSADEYADAVATARDLGLGPNDAVAYNAMVTEGISEIYSMDHHFDDLPGIIRLPKILHLE